MKAATVLHAAALVVRIGLIDAIGVHNHGHKAVHQRHHNAERSIATAHVAATVTVTVTATDHSAIVWLDHQGNVVSTEYKDEATTTALSPTLPAPDVGNVHINDDAAIRVVDTTALDQPQTLTATTTPAPSLSSTTSTAATSSASTPASSSAANKEPVAGALKGFSVAYDTIRSGGCRDAEVDITYLANQGTGLVRIYGIGCPLGSYIQAASKHNVKLMIGLNNIDNFNADLNKLIDMVTSSLAGWGPVDTVYIGNECMSNGKSAAVVAGAVSTAKGILSTRGFNGNVVTVEMFAAMMNDPVACSTSSYCAINAHPYFDAHTSASTAGSFVRYAVNQVAAKNPGKRVVVTETGWPHRGGTNGNAIASPDNQRTALGSIMKEFAGSPGDVYLFQAWNAAYKAPGQYGIEQFFGVFDDDHFNGNLGG